MAKHLKTIYVVLAVIGAAAGVLFLLNLFRVIDLPRAVTLALLSLMALLAGLVLPVLYALIIVRKLKE